jgi:hypothetical protein
MWGLDRPRIDKVQLRLSLLFFDSIVTGYAPSFVRGTLRPVTTAIAKMSRAALERKAEGAERKAVRQAKAAEKVGEKVLDVVGGLTATATAMTTGILEERFKDPKTGIPLSVGPVPLTLAMNLGLGGLSLIWNPGRQVSYAAAGMAGAFGVTRGRMWGKAWRAMSKAPPTRKRTKGIGYDDDDSALDEVEEALIAELEDGY